MRERLWVQIAASFLLFVVVGTVGLIFLLDTAYQRLSYGEFVALARANADFIHSEHLACTERLAVDLSQMLGVEVRFGRVETPDKAHEAVTIPIDADEDLTLIRERPTLRELVLRPITLAALTAFWALWFALAWAVVRPYLRAQRLALLGGVATSLAHEIRNPIAAIRLHAQLLQKAQPEGAGIIVDEATRIEDLVNQWMFLARPEPPRKSTVLMADLLNQSVRLAAPAAEHAGVKIVLDADRDQRLDADPRRLSQVFHNIIFNAIQAMPDGGNLTITARNGAISFADTGPGFSPTALTRWAEMLYSEKEGGMGIGLNVAQRIVRAHGGRLSVANQPAGGAVVRIEL
ncbi:MAG TPA: ATP-binding protein [Candidatus Baltobacteraceae bacterium]|jgi:signal transduction histidine kinase|nr:ATP-binding protein [Candidatus Baltobacteraceae bacterium]